MPSRKLTKLELRVMDALWKKGASSVREIHESFPKRGRPAYTTVQTTVYRLEVKGALRRVDRVGNANVFAAITSRDEAQRNLIDHLLAMFGGQGRPIMARLVEAGTLTLDDIKEAEQVLRKTARKDPV